MDRRIGEARPADFEAIADLNVRAYREFAAHLSPEGWARMEANLRDVALRARNTVFLTAWSDGELAGSVGYGPPGTGDPSIFPPVWATLVLLSVAPAHPDRGSADG